jgi:hypothetical protein
MLMTRRHRSRPADPPDIGDAEVSTGGTMIYTSGTTGKPKGASPVLIQNFSAPCWSVRLPARRHHHLRSLYLRGPRS